LEDSATFTAAPAPAKWHALWVRATHWILAAVIVALIVSGFTILMGHPRFYWGEGGNDLTTALFELPIGPNSGGVAFSQPQPFFGEIDGAATANRLESPWNQNSWARSLHFLTAWIFLAVLLVYLGIAGVSGHARRNLLPRRGELAARNILQDIRSHLKPGRPVDHIGPPYAILQKLAYALVLFLALPLMLLTGISMSPAITASYPILLDLFGGTQSARTIHFFGFAFVAAFLLVHLSMVLISGPVRLMRGMIFGGGQ
jgi:thiosulfate reductase cytochrome b subunit